VYIIDKVINKNFIERLIDKDLSKRKYTNIAIRFLFETNGYLNIKYRN